ncbi:hypothetical protein [Mucilaginibacter ginkgonis]|uniref:Uncharacterized protein n=1 Tax=Mucilaginibacter ginkgonis TaxID=2682091 RepID=A0A6I4HYV1_9SPHI|nr:hypothetical protein [Mucilaginibacter ginkgonis]QQL49765.1 hypothetical protein GO620_016595 [Mucilaginibacter ginkgonis]
MKNFKALLFIIISAISISSCVSQEETKTKCGSIMCTDEFIMVPIRLIATKSSTISFKSYKVINLAAGKQVRTKDVVRDSPATLIIADDSNRKDFPESVQNLQLQVTRNDGRVVTANYKIGGGKCACHVSKLSGPDQVDIDQ